MGKALADNETRLRKYDDLSEKERKAVDEKLKSRVASAKQTAESGDTFGQRASDLVSGGLYGTAAAMGSSAAARSKARTEAEAAERDARRKADLKKAEDSASDTGKRSGLYSSETSQKLYKKGGKVSSASSRADGIAQRGKTKGKMV
jgi:hypothetical protein